jgi:glutathione S-transferase
VTTGRATLYRCRTPTDWLCPCGRVARGLRKHAIAYDEVRLDRADRTAVDDLTGQPKVPVLDLDGEAIADSKRIVEHLRWRADQA